MKVIKVKRGESRSSARKQSGVTGKAVYVDVDAERAYKFAIKLEEELGLKGYISDATLFGEL